MPKVLVVAETKNGELKKPTLELLSLAKSMNLQAESVLIGKEVSSQADLALSIYSRSSTAVMYLGNEATSWTMPTCCRYL